MTISEMDFFAQIVRKGGGGGGGGVGGAGNQVVL